MNRPVKAFDAILNAVVMELQRSPAAKVKLILEIEAEALFMTWLALSGSAFLLERMSPEPVMIERVPEASAGDLRP